MKNATEFFLKNKRFTVVVSAFLLVYGIIGLRRMNSESYPAVSLATATITTRYQGASAEDIETKITKPIEDEIQGVVGIKDISSVSKSGLSVITVRVDMDNYDVSKVMEEIQKEVDGVTGLPVDLAESPEFFEANSEELPVFNIAIIGPNDRRQRDLISEDVQELLEDIEAVKSVNLTAHAEREFEIRLDHDKLRRLHIGISEVLSKIAQRNVSIPGGNLKKIDDESLVRVQGKIAGAEDLRGFLIRSNFSGQRVTLGDIAEVKDGREEPRLLARYGDESAALLSVVKKAGEDTIALVDRVKRELEAFEKTKRFPEIRLVPYLNDAEKVEARLDVLSSNALSGLALVIAFLFVFLPRKIAFAASFSLPLAVMGTFGLMPAFGMNLDAITVLALIISIGMLVDNSVVISESYSRYRSEGLEPQAAAGRAVRELGGAITASALTTIAAFLPMLVTKGVMGAFIMVIPIIVTCSLVFSLGESLFLLPMRLVGVAACEKDPSELESKGSLFSAFEGRFDGIIRAGIRHRYLAMLGMAGIILLSGVFAGYLNRFELFPADETEVYLARVETEGGTTLEKTDEVMARLALDIKKELGDRAKHVVSISGEQRADINDPKAGDGDNLGLLRVYVDDDTKYNVAHTEILRRLRALQIDYAKKVEFEEVINGPPVGSPIEGKFRSNNAAALDRMVRAVLADLGKVAGVSDLRVADVVGEDEVFVDVDFAQADRVGLSVKEIGDTIRAAVAGNAVSEVTLENREVKLRVRLKKNFREDLDALGRLKIMNAKGNLITLSTVAKFERRPGTPQIKRYQRKRSRTIVGNVDETKVTSQRSNALLKESFDKHSATIKGVTLYQGGAAESTAESMASLANASVLAAIGILGLLVLMFDSFLKPLIIMTTIPLGLFGFTVAFWAHGRPISFMALIGIIGLAGIIVNSGIVLISYIDQLRAEDEKDARRNLGDRFSGSPQGRARDFSDHDQRPAAYRLRDRRERRAFDSDDLGDGLGIDDGDALDPFLDPGRLQDSRGCRGARRPVDVLEKTALSARRYFIAMAAVALGLGALVMASDDKDDRNRSSHFRDGRFRNPGGASAKTFWDYLKTRAGRDWAKWPKWIKTDYGPKPSARVSGNPFRVTVVNHATVLIQGYGYNILTDPIYSKRCSPVQFLGPKRVQKPGIKFEDLPKIDVILISHDHYDHLDLPTLERLVARDNPRVYLGLGVGKRLKSMENVTEMDWWERQEAGDHLAVTFVPVQHFSGRGLFDRDSTLWGGYVLELGNRKVYFGGDSGYGDHYLRTFERFGPMDLSFLPIGAYAPRDFMGYAHLDPKQAVRAHQDLKSRTSIGIHFGTFQLTSEPIDEPKELLAQERSKAGIPEEAFLVPDFGKSYEIRFEVPAGAPKS